MNLGRWIKAPKLKQRPAKAEDIEPLFNTFQRVRKLRGVAEHYENVIITWKNGAPSSMDEWALVVEIRGYDEYVWDIVAYLLRTTDKAKAVRRAYGWGLRDEDGNVVWPPEREDDESDDIDDDPYVAYMPEPEIRY